MAQAAAESTWTAFPSLLPALAAAERQALEDAVCAGQCGRYSEADRIFDEDLATSSSTAAFVLNRADLLSNASRELERHQLLRDFVATTQTDGRQTSEQILSRFMLADSNFWLRGTVRPFVDALLAVRSHLAYRELDALTDIEIRCMTMYYDGVATLASNSNFIVEHNKTCFGRHRGDKYAEARELRESLQAQQRLRFAATAMQLELKACKTQEENANSIRVAFHMANHLIQQPQSALRYRGIVLSGFLSAKLAAMKTQQMSNTLNGIRIAALQAITPPRFVDWRQFCPTISADEERDTAIHGAPHEPLQLAHDKLDALASSCIQARNYTKANQSYEKIRNILHDALMKRAGASEDKNIVNLVHANSLKLITFHRETTHMAYFEVKALCDYIAHCLSFQNSHRRFLALIHEFCTNHQDMEVPNVLERLFDLGMTSARALGDTAAFAYYSHRYSLVLNDCSFMNTDGGLADESVIDPSLAIRHMQTESIGPRSQGIAAISLMLKWAAYEIRNGQLSSAQAHFVFDGLQIDLAAAALEDLEHQSAMCFERICGTEEVLAPSIGFIRSANRLLDWVLKQDRKPSRQFRLSTLRVFMYARIVLQRLHLIRTRTNMDSNNVEEQNAFDEANDALSKEEKALDVVIRLEAGDAEPSSTHTDENFVQRILRDCHRFRPQHLVSAMALDEALTRCYRIIRVHQDSSALLKWYHSLVQLIRLKWQKAIRASTFTSSEIASIISDVEEADSVFRGIRAALSSPDASAQFVALVKGANDFLQSEHYRYAFAALHCRYRTLAVTEGSDSSDSHDTINALADWSLRAKGKSLIGLLQGSALEWISESRDRPGDLNGIRHDLSSLEIGQSSSRHMSSKQIASMPTDEVTLIELVDASYSTLHSKLVALVYKKDKDKPVTLVELNLAHQTVAQFVMSELDGPCRQERTLASTTSQAQLDNLKPIIDPFVDPSSASFIPKGVTIVWSLTGALYRLPIHAISVGDEFLIQRNPIIYTQSLALLHHQWALMAESKPALPALSTVISPLPSDWESSRAARDVAEWISHVKVLRGRSCSRSQVMLALQGSSIVNFQGHAFFDPIEPMRSALRLGSKKERIDVRDILLSVRLAFPALCTLFACESGKTIMTSTDDVLSLPAALHHAGASNVVSTLWPVDDHDGAVFATKFYEELFAAQTQEKRQSPSSANTCLDYSSSSINLAKVMQATTIAMLNEAVNEEQRLPYHWAGFFMQGCWQRQRFWND